MSIRTIRALLGPMLLAVVVVATPPAAAAGPVPAVPGVETGGRGVPIEQGPIPSPGSVQKILPGDPRTMSTEIAGLRDAIYDAAYWYLDYQTVVYTWSDYWTPCNMYQADCECFNRLVYWDAGWGQLTYTLQGQSNTGWQTWSPTYGDLFFIDYNGDGYAGPYDHTGIFMGYYNGRPWGIHSSTYSMGVQWNYMSTLIAEASYYWYSDIVG